MSKVFLYIALFSLALSSCSYFTPSNKAEEDPILRVYDSYLYPSDLVGLNLHGMSKEDSAQLVEKFIKEWSRYQVIAEKAKEKDNIDLEAIELKAEQLKFQLITYEFEKSLIDSNLDTLVSEQEINDYYEQHKSDFELRQNIIRGQFVKIHKSSPKVYNFKLAFISNEDSKKEYIEEYCVENADHYLLNDTVWLNFNEVVYGSPFQRIEDQADFLKKPSNTSKYDGTYYYYLKVVESRLKNDISPMQFHKKEISDIIYNQRKLKLIKNVEDKLIKEALDEQSIEYYN